MNAESVTGLVGSGLVVALVLGVTWAIRKTTALKKITGWLPIVALAVGGAAGLFILTPMPWTLAGAATAFGQGLLLGLMAAGGYDVAAAKTKIGKQTAAAAADSAGGFIRPLLLVILALAAAALFAAAGCGDAGFTRYAMGEAQSSMLQARLALDESRRDLAVDRDREAELQWKAYIRDQADTFAKAKVENPTPEALKAGLGKLAVDLRARLATLEKNRQETDKRFIRAEQHMDFMATIFARLDAQARRDESIQAQLAAYQAMAEQVAREKFGLPPKVPPAEAPPVEAVVP